MIIRNKKTFQKIVSFFITDIKLIIRYCILLWTIPLIFGIPVLICYWNKTLMPYALYITIFSLLTSYEYIFNNILCRDPYEFWAFNIFPHSYKNIFIAKNISNTVIAAVSILFINISMTIIFKLPFSKLAQSLQFFLPTLFLLLIIGNYFSIRSQMGDNKRRGSSLGHLFLQQMILFFSLGFYLLITKVFRNKLYYIIYCLFIVAIYFLSLRRYSSFLIKNKYKILESQ